MIPGQRTALYVKALSDLTEKQLAFGFEQALKLFKPEFGKTFPLPAEIREWGFEWRPPEIQDSLHILDRGDKPPDWEQLKPGELEAMKAASKTRQEEVREQVKAWAAKTAMTGYTPSDDSEFEAMRKRQLERRKSGAA